ncbi:hypothetical protein FRC10_003745 [Ceratobasidium sp. 414]|nr:hypothetical protein FRC10_003745 [Ceratobasidium sp. 414]
MPAEVKQLVLTIIVRAGLFRYSKQSLKRDVEAAKSRLFELQSSGDKDALQAWNGRLLTKALEVARNNRSNDLKREWREQAERALIAQGYSLPKDEGLPSGKRYKWKELMERPVTWTEGNWNKQKSKVIQFIKDEEKERPAREQKERRSARDNKLRELFDSLQHTTNVLPDSEAELPVVQAMDLMVKWPPLPRYDDALEWPAIRNLVETDVAIEEMTNQFEERRGEIVGLIADWGKQAKQELANILRAGMKMGGLAADPPRPRLLTSGRDTNPFDNLDEDTCLLFRADTIFHYGCKYSEDKLQSYDSLVGFLRPGMHLQTTKNKGKLDFTLYTWSSEATSTARALLSAMGHPEDAASNRVAHYIKQASDWEYVQKKLSELAKEHIVYKNIHDPALVGEEAEALETKHLEKNEEKGEDEDESEDGGEDEDEDDYRFACRLCMNAEIESPMSTDIEKIFPHLIDV